MRIKEIGALVAIICLCILFSYPYHQGISPFDDGDYLKCAVNLLKGQWDTQNFYSHRIGTYAPMALAYKIFGFTPLLTWLTAFELVAFVVLLYALLRKYNSYIALVSCALVALLPDVVVMSGHLLGDILTMATTNLCILWVWRTGEIKTPANQIFAGVALGLLWYISFLVKESAFFYLLPLLIFCIADARAKRNNFFWLGSLATGLILGGLYLALYYQHTGDAFFRLHAVETGPNASESNYALAPASEILMRLTLHPLKFLVENFSYMAIVLAGFMQFLSKPLNRNEKFFNLFMVSVLGCWWLGTQSLTSWNPVALISRIWLPVLVPLCINSAHTLYYISTGQAQRYRNNYTLALILLLAVVSVSVPFLNAGDIFWQQKPIVFLAPRIFMLLSFYLLIFKAAWVEMVLLFLKRNIVLVIFFSAFIYYNVRTNESISGKDSDYYAELEILETIKSTHTPVALIVETAVQSNYGIYNNFSATNDSLMHIYDWKKIDSINIQNLITTPVYFMVNDYRLFQYKNLLSETQNYASTNRKKIKEQLPKYFSNLGPNWILIKKNARASLYKYQSK